MFIIDYNRSHRESEQMTNQSGGRSARPHAPWTDWKSETHQQSFEKPRGRSFRWRSLSEPGSDSLSANVIIWAPAFSRRLHRVRHCSWKTNHYVLGLRLSLNHTVEEDRAPIIMNPAAQSLRRWIRSNRLSHLAKRFHRITETGDRRFSASGGYRVLADPGEAEYDAERESQEESALPAGLAGIFLGIVGDRIPLAYSVSSIGKRTSIGRLRHDALDWRRYRL